jgi:hypothetical protein
MAAATKESAPSFEDLFPNDSATKLTKSELRTLVGKETKDNGGKKGALHALSLYTLIIYRNKNPNEVLLKGAIESERKEHETLDSFFKIQDEIEFGKFRDAMIFWLKKHLGLTKEEAQEAEQIAWNLIYLSNIVEECDSRFNSKIERELPTGRIPPAVSQQYSPVTRHMQHPQERLEGKLKAGKFGEGVVREAWGAFGEWALNNLQKRGRDPRRTDILPRSLFGNAFEYMDCKVNGQDTNWLRLLMSNGERLINDPKAKIDEPDWEKLDNTPLAPYFFDRINPAIKVFKVIQNGEWEGPISQLGNACRKLGLEKKYRERLLMATKGIDAKSQNLKAVGFSPIKWASYLAGIRKYAPNFFK